MGRNIGLLIFHYNSGYFQTRAEVITSGTACAPPKACFEQTDHGKTQHTCNYVHVTATKDCDPHLPEDNLPLAVKQAAIL